MLFFIILSSFPVTHVLVQQFMSYCIYPFLVSFFTFIIYLSYIKGWWFLDAVTQGCILSYEWMMEEQHTGRTLASRKRS